MESDNRKQQRYNLCWGDALKVHRGLLEYYASHLLPCACTNQIVERVESKVKSVMVPDEFKVGYLLRTLAQTVILHLRECTQTSDALFPNQSADCLIGIQRLPTEERLVYFLREVLNYRTRDASLLLGISDVHVEQLLSFARNRIRQSEQSATPDLAHWQYFRWRFADLGR